MRPYGMGCHSPLWGIASRLRGSLHAHVRSTQRKTSNLPSKTAWMVRFRIGLFSTLPPLVFYFCHPRLLFCRRFYIFVTLRYYSARFVTIVNHRWRLCRSPWTAHTVVVWFTERSAYQNFYFLRSLPHVWGSQKCPWFFYWTNLAWRNVPRHQGCPANPRV